MNNLEEDRSEKFWNSLTKEEQLDAFCSVTRRIYKGEIEIRGSFRKILYDVFGFGLEAYYPAYSSGFMTIHNSIVTFEEEKEMLKNNLLKFAEDNSIEKEKVEEFMKGFFGNSY